MTSTQPISPTAVTATTSDSDIDQEIFAERRRDRRHATLMVWSIRIAVTVAFIGGWYLAVHRGLIDELFVSSPEKVGKAFIDQLTDPSFWTDARGTFTGAITGLFAGSILGIMSGVILSRSLVLDRALSPFLTLINSLPRPALAPIFILWFGLGFAPKALVAASVVYFILLTSTRGALRSLDHDINLLTRSMKMSPWQRFAKVEFPSALPAIVGGMRLGAVYSVLGAVLAEMVGSYIGLGQRLVVLSANFQVAEGFAVLLAMGIMSMLLDFAISGLQRVIERRY